MRIVKLAAACTALLLLSLAWPGSASAHDQSRWYNILWWEGTDVEYGFDYSWPDDPAFKYRVVDGDDEWSSLGGTEGEPDFLRWLPDGQYGTRADCLDLSYARGAIYMEDLDWDSDTTLAYATVCDDYDSNTRADTFTIAFDTASEANWYTGTGDAYDGIDTGVAGPLYAENDLWSAASHEWGHVTGHIGGENLGHWYEGWRICPDGNYRHTLCATIPRGSEMMRTPAKHDRHTFTSAYSG